MSNVDAHHSQRSMRDVDGWRRPSWAGAIAMVVTVVVVGRAFAGSGVAALVGVILALAAVALATILDHRTRHRGPSHRRPIGSS
jgi:hypothetical protein